MASTTPMSESARYHRVRRHDAAVADDIDDSDAEQCPHPPAAAVCAALIAFWLLTILVTALLTTAVNNAPQCGDPADTAASSDSASSKASFRASSLAGHLPRLAPPALAPDPSPLLNSAPVLSTEDHTVAHNPWSALPSLTLLVRTYSHNWPEMLQFHFTYSLHWPRLYTHSGLLFVLDEERASDRRLGTLLLHAWDGGDRLTSPSRISVAYEALPGAGILSDRWRGSLGYCRQQYSNFYADLYTDRDYVGVVDTDAYFMRPPTPDDVFQRTADPHSNASAYKPVIIGYNGDTLWCASAEYMIGKPCAGEYMINFPVTIKRAHFAPMRAHIMAHLNASSFEVAWRRMLTAVGDDMRREYSQFTIMATYLWHFHHDDYAWRVNSQRDKRHKRLKHLLYDTANATAMAASPAYRDMATRMAQYDIPAARYVQHPMKSVGKLVDVYEALCVASDYAAGDCATHDADARARMRQRTLAQWYTDEEPDTERLWTSEQQPDVQRNADGVVDRSKRLYAGQWRRYEWPRKACGAAGEAGGAGSSDEVSGCERDGGIGGQPFIHRPHRVTYNASDGTFREPEELQPTPARSADAAIG